MTKVKLLRALNENDIIINPLENGIVSKNLLLNVIKELINKYEPNILNKMSDSEIKLYVFDRTDYYIKNYKDEFNMLVSKEMEPVNKLITCLNNKEFTARNYILWQSYLSGLLPHTRNGSKITTDWISATCSLDALKRYYNNQKINKVAIIGMDFNGFTDGYTPCINLSSKEAIQIVNRSIPKHIDRDVAQIFADLSIYDSGLGNVFKEEYVHNTTTNFPGYKYAINSKEVCFYNQIISSEVVNVIGKLEMDLIFSGILDVKYLDMDRDEQIKKLQIIKGLLLIEIKKKNLQLQRAYNKLYVKNINDYTLDKERIAIMSLSKKLKF